MTPRITSDQAITWSLWATCVVSVAGGVLALAAPSRGENRIAPMALPFAVAAIVLAANALTQHRNRWLTAVLYAVASLAIVYAIMLGLSVPLALLVEGACQPAPAPCPLGFGRPLSGGESFGLEAAEVCGALALVLSLVALELQYRPRLRLFPAPPVLTDPEPRPEEPTNPEPRPEEPTNPAAKTDA